MLKTCGYWLAFTTISDRQAISKNHHQLLDQRCWELSSPSQALPVLEVLLRSGTVVEGLERAARDSVCNMSPCMTRREQSLLQKVASMWGQSPSFSHSPSPSIDSASFINTTVLHGYDGACGGADVPDTMRELIASPAQLQQLTLPSCLILLEMVSSPRFQWVGPAPSGAALDLLLNYLRVQLNQLPQKALSWKVLWWLLQLVGEARPAPLSDVVLGSPSCAARLYSCCVRRLHEQWPLLTMEERLLSYLGLFEASHTRTTDRPVLVLHEMAHSLSRSPVDDFTPAPTQLLLRYSLQCTRTTPSPSFAQRSHLLELCYSWELHDRINTMDGGACLAAYSILTYMHRHCPVEDSLTVAEAEAWRTLHDRLHAQAFLCTSNYDADSCVRMLEQAEEINLSPWGLTVPSTFVEKLKRRIFALARQALRQAGAMPEYPDATLHILQAVLTCRQIGLRYTVLPFSDRDDCTAQHLTRELKQLLSSSDRVPAEGFGKK